MANKHAGENGKATRFRAGNPLAKKGAEVSNTVQRQRAMFREAFKERMTEDRMEKIFNALCEKAEAGDVQAAAFLRDTMGEKPTERVEQTINEIAFRIEGVSDEQADRISG